MKHFLFIFCTMLVLSNVKSQEFTLLGGVRFQKTHNFYFENGVSFEYTQQKYLQNKIFAGFSYITSRLGSAISSNAIKQDNYLFSAGYRFRTDKIVCPSVQLNTGFFHAVYPSPVFDDLQNNSMLLSLEPGIFINPPYPVKAKFSFGYNIITGNGMSGPGTLFPLYFQCSIYYIIICKMK